MELTRRTTAAGAGSAFAALLVATVVVTVVAGSATIVRAGEQAAEQPDHRAGDHATDHGADKAADHATDGATSHRRFDDAARWAKVFDDPRRDEWQKPAELLRALAVQGDMAVADLGAGTGYFTAHLSSAVGGRGAVYAVDVEPSLVAHLRDRADREGLANVVPVLGSAASPRLAPASVDLMVLLDTYHHVDDRRDYLLGLHRILRPGGRVAVVEWKAGKQPEGPKEEDHKIPRARVEAEMREAGFEALPAPDILPYQYLVVFRAVPR